MHIATISSKRQITLPKKMLDELGVKPNSKVIIKKEEETICLEPVSANIVDELGGSLRNYIHPSKLGVPWKKVKEEVGKAIGEHAAKEGLG